jgi:hypothetical protein
VSRQLKLGDWNCSGKLEALIARGEVEVAALSTFLIEAGKGRRTRDVRRRFQQFREQLRDNTWGWGAAGRALYQIGDYRECADWMGDWAEREDPESWMLLHLVLALRHLRREPEAREVGAAALELPEDTGTLSHVIWLAFDEQLAGGEWDEELFQMDVSEAGSFYICLHSLVRALMLQRDLPASFAKIRSLVASARSAQPGWWRDALLSRAVDATVMRIADEAATPWARLWSLTRFWRFDWP